MDGPRDFHIEWSQSDRGGEISYNIPDTWNLKKKWSKWTSKTERDSQTYRTNLWLLGRRDSSGVSDGHAHTAIFKMVNWQGLHGSGVWGRMDTHIYMAGSLHCSPETITALLIDYTPIQNKKFKKRSLNLSIMLFVLKLFYTFQLLGVLTSSSDLV